MPDAVMLDTMVCIWAFKGQATKGQESKIPQSRALLASLEANDVEIGISAVSLSELMVRMRDEERFEFIQRFQKGFCIYPFDTSAAVESARLVNNWIKAGKKGKSERNVVKADLQIAGRDIDVRPLPPIEQPELDL